MHLDTPLRSRMPSLLLAALVLCAAAAPLACSNDGDDGPPHDNGESRRCEGRVDCDGGLACVDGECGNCGSDGDCARNERCNAASLICQFRKGWGDDCSAHTDCALGLSCSQGLCMPVELTIECGARGQCPEGMRCNKGLKICEEDLGCSEEQDCDEGEVCNRGTAQCVLACTPETEVDVCAAREHCADGLCIECTGDDECDLGFLCHAEAGRCVGSKTCFTDRDCEAGLVCNRGTKSCTIEPPPCFHDNECLPSEYCDLRRQACTSRECTGDQDSPNGSQEFATPITGGIRSNLRACRLEQKWYKIELLRGDRLNILVETDFLAADGLDAELRDALGNVLAKDPFLLDATIGADGTYYLLVRTQDDHVRYSLNVLVSKGEPCDDDRFGGTNDSTIRAAPLPRGTEMGLVRCPGSSDFYVVDVPQGEGVEVTLNHDPLKGLLHLMLRDSDGQTQLGIDTSTNGEKTLQVPSVSRGRAYVVVYSTNARVRNTYDLTIKAP